MSRGSWSRREVLRSAGVVGAGMAVGAKRRALGAAPATAGRLRFAVQTPPQHVSYGELARAWRDADRFGFEAAFVFDHFMPIFSDPNGPCFEGWTLLAALASRTERLRVGVLVTGNTYRHPALLAKCAVTVDHATGGRLVLGIGAGWFEREHTAYGLPFYTTAERARRLGEAVEVLKALFTRERTTYAGKYYTLTDAPFEPKSLQKPHPPILVGGMGPKLVQPVAARHAQIWHFFVRDGDVAAVQRLCANFDALCQRVGRDPAEVAKSTSLRPEELRRPAGEVRDRIRALADAGVSYFMLQLAPPFEGDLMRRFASDVIPAVTRSA